MFTNGLLASGTSAALINRLRLFLVGFLGSLLLVAIIFAATPICGVHWSNLSELIRCEHEKRGRIAVRVFEFGRLGDQARPADR